MSQPNIFHLENPRFIQALLREPVDKTPVWIMRQAGRYLPEYRALRAQSPDFMQFVQTPALAVEATLQPVVRFPLDAAILFSDILTIPHAMQVGVHFVAGEGPRIARPIRNTADVDALPIPDPTQELRYVMDTVTSVQQELAGRIPLIGFAGSPWTLATYMVEGGPSRDFQEIKKMLYTAPELLHSLLDKLATAVTHYLNAQIASGVNAVMLFDTWGGVLSHAHYRTFSLNYMQKIIAGLRLQREDRARRVPCILFTKGGGQWLEAMADTGVDAIGLDWTTSLGDARRRVGDRVALQGNCDPAALYAPLGVLEQCVRDVLEDYGPGPGHVFNLGHGITPDVLPDKVMHLIETVHSNSRPNRPRITSLFL